jgi:hypothetical protein
MMLLLHQAMTPLGDYQLAKFSSGDSSQTSASLEGEQTRPKSKVQIPVLSRGQALPRWDPKSPQVTEIQQGPSNSPEAFLLWLKDALQKHTSVVPGSQEERISLRHKFLTQSAPGIYKKLQKLVAKGSRGLDQLSGQPNWYTMIGILKRRKRRISHWKF